ncbi:MAG: heme exporter protein CcmB [bacterium]
MSTFGQLKALIWKDVLAELRTKEMVVSMLVFALLVIVIFVFAFDPGSGAMAEAAPGILWVAYTFAAILGLNRSFVLEQENQCLQGLLLTPVDRSVIYLGKFMGNLIFVGVIELIILPVFVVLFDLSLTFGGLGWLLLIIVLSTAGFVAVGTLFSAISANTKAREILLPILLFPVTVPVLISAVKITGLVLQAEPASEIWPWLKLLIAFDLIFITVAFLTFEYVVED